MPALAGADGLHSGLVTESAWFVAQGRPTSVAVHNDSYVGRDAFGSLEDPFLESVYLVNRRHFHIRSWGDPGIGVILTALCTLYHRQGSGTYGDVGDADLNTVMLRKQHAVASGNHPQ